MSYPYAIKPDVAPDPTRYTEEQKLAMYRSGEYVFQVPPVQTWMWDEAAWIKWIDHVSGWRPTQK